LISAYFYDTVKLVKRGGKMIKTLLKSNDHNGKYVAFKNFNDTSVVGEGSTPKEAYDQAIKRGSKDPVVAFVPVKGMVQIY
jgi:hypothetical protein